MNKEEYRILQLLNCFKSNGCSCDDTGCSSHDVCESFEYLVEYGRKGGDW